MAKVITTIPPKKEYKKASRIMSATGILSRMFLPNTTAKLS